MSVKILRIITFISILVTLKCSALSGPSNVLRACVDFRDSTITLSWKNADNTCGSFSHSEIYASKNNGSFVNIQTVNNYTITEYPHKLTDQNTTWKYYLISYFACNGTDTYTSNTVSVDLTYPANIELDSVSYEHKTQNIIAGWKANPSPDTKRYELYNYSTGDGDLISTTTNTLQTISANPAKRFPIVLATIDSCSLSSLLSSPHEVMYLNTIFDTCLRQAELTWNLYKGWNQIDSQAIFASINGGSFEKITTLNGTSMSFTINNITLGDDLDVFIRAYTENGTISSSSNRANINTRKHIVPQIYLSQVTVVGEQIEIAAQCSSCEDVATYTVNRGTNGNIKETASSAKTSLVFNHIDNEVNPNEIVYQYFVSGKNYCNETLSASNVSQNILLLLEPSVNNSPYIGWGDDVRDYTLERKTKETGSTWNAVEISSQPFIQSTYKDTAGCYRIVATENKTDGTIITSESNIVCKEEALKIFVSNAINLKGNNSFVIKGAGIDHQKSNYAIYNRWGEAVAANNTEHSWDGTFKGTNVLPGIYLYTVSVFGMRGEYKSLSGTIYIYE